MTIQTTNQLIAEFASVLGQPASVKSLTNGQLYDEWNEAVWAKLRGERTSPEYQARLNAIEAELSLRPAEVA